MGQEAAHATLLRWLRLLEWNNSLSSVARERQPDGIARHWLYCEGCAFWRFPQCRVVLSRPFRKEPEKDGHPEYKAVEMHRCDQHFLNQPAARLIIERGQRTHEIID
jgi:hypothetical protein